MGALHAIEQWRTRSDLGGGGSKEGVGKSRGGHCGRPRG